MIQNGLSKIRPDHRDFSLLHTFGYTTTDPRGLPDSFSIYDGRVIPNQNEEDGRFNPALPPLLMGCTGETGAFECGIEDGKLYNPKELYDNTPPGGVGGREVRAMLERLRTVGPQTADGTRGPRRTAYFNCYGAGPIDDFDAARIGLYINQQEKRGVYIGSWWYWGSRPDTTLVLPSFDIKEASLHEYLATGWKSLGNMDYLEIIPWLGQEVGENGRFYLSRVLYNALMLQPYTAAYTITKLSGQTPIPIGFQAYIDHLIYFIRSLFKI